MKTFSYFLFFGALFSCLMGCMKNLPENDDVEKGNDFIGDWLVSEKSSILGDRVYSIIISVDSVKNNQLNIQNLYALGIEEYVYVEESTFDPNSFTIPSQTVSNHSISGSGTLIDDQIEMTYFVDDSNVKDTVKTTCTKDFP